MCEKKKEKEEECNYRTDSKNNNQNIELPLMCLAFAKMSGNDAGPEMGSNEAVLPLLLLLPSLLALTTSAPADFDGVPVEDKLFRLLLLLLLPGG